MLKICSIPLVYPWNATITDISAIDKWLAHQHITTATEKHHKQADKRRGGTPMFQLGDR